MSRLSSVYGTRESVVAEVAYDQMSAVPKSSYYPYGTRILRQPTSDEQKPYLKPYVSRTIHSAPANTYGPSRSTHCPSESHQKTLWGVTDQLQDSRNYRADTREAAKSTGLDEAGDNAASFIQNSHLYQLPLLRQPSYAASSPLALQRNHEARTRAKLAVVPNDVSDLQNSFAELSIDSRSSTAIPLRTKSSRADVVVPVRSQGIPNRQSVINQLDVINHSPVEILDDPDYKAAPAITKSQVIRRKPVGGSSKCAAASAERKDPTVNDLDADYRLALELAEGVPQDFDTFVIARRGSTTRQHNQQAIDEETHWHSRRTFLAKAASLRNHQDEWSSRWDGHVREQQIPAQQVFELEQPRETANTSSRRRSRRESLRPLDDRQRRSLDNASPIELETAHDTRPLNQRPSSIHYHEPPPPYSPQQFAYVRPSEESEPSHDVYHPVPIRPIAYPANHNRFSISGPPQASAPGYKTSFEHNPQHHRQTHGQWQAAPTTDVTTGQTSRQSLQDLETQYRRDLNRSRQSQAKHRNRQDREHQRLNLDRQRRLAEDRPAREHDARRQKARVRTLDCTVCGDAFDPSAVYRFPCTHIYCRDCLTQSIQIAIKDRSAFRCCRQRVHVASASSLLPRHLIADYSFLILELDTPNPIYCSRRRCSVFIPPARIKAGTATCQECDTRTCASCKDKAHAGVCRQDRDGQAVLSLGEQKGWQTCPNCGNMVERTEGCLHMTCRCGQDFCYACGKTRSRCGGVCRR